MSTALSQRALLSQNFLKDPRLVAALLDRFPLDDNSAVYEIGPGEGIITEELARRYRQVVAIEKDVALAQRLQRRFSAWPNVRVQCGDFLHYRLPCGPYAVFANIPFNITTAIVTKLTAAQRAPDVAYLVMQREAADMYLGKPQESLRTVLLKPWFETEIVHHFKRSDFVPAPRVDVVMLRLRKRGPPLVRHADQQYFRDFVTYLFTHWQPTTVNPLKGIFTGRQFHAIERELGIRPGAGPTSLTVAQWLALFARAQVDGNERARTSIAGSDKHLIQQQRRLQKIHRTRAMQHRTPHLRRRMT